MRRGGSIYAVALTFLLFCVPLITAARHINRSHSRQGYSDPTTADTKDEGKVAKEILSWEERLKVKRMRGGPDTLQVAGSRLPDCSHACGTCSPCRLVMVSFVCASLAEAETCPMAYKCMCQNKSYPVP